MVNPEKILSVSFGHFSCTLQGFDDPLATMRAVVDHFRDVVAQDGAFGDAEPAPGDLLLERVVEHEAGEDVAVDLADGTIMLRRHNTPDEASDAQGAPAFGGAAGEDPQDVPDADLSLGDDLDGLEPIDDGSDCHPVAAEDARPGAAQDDPRDSVQAFLAELADDGDRADASMHDPRSLPKEAKAPASSSDAQDEEPATEPRVPHALDEDVPPSGEDAPVPGAGGDRRETDAAIDRLMTKTDIELCDADGHRRRSAIAHLKAAVAATRAEAHLKDERRQKGDRQIGQFRDDLARVVRPNRPAARPGHSSRPDVAASARAQTLTLTARHRVDRDGAGLAEGISPARPRRITVADAGDAATGSGFSAFAARVGAAELPDMIEAAAAYALVVEGRESLTRPAIMRRAASATGKNVSREETLRSFGELLRSGRLRELAQNRFAIDRDAEIVEKARATAP